MNTSLKKTEHHENYIVEILKLLVPYKWSILAITLIFILLAKYKLYFIAPTYESYAVVKVKVNNQTATKDVLRDTLNQTNSAGIKQEMAILKTYRTNKDAIETINFQVRYFKKEQYKMVELYKEAPISVENLEKTNIHFINHQIILTVHKDGFTLTTEELGESEVYPFGTQNKTPYFTATINKNRDFTEKIYLSFTGNSRYIYENIVKGNLFISQVNSNANLIRVAYQDTIPERANDYVNALIKSYVAQSIQKKENTNNRILDFLNKQLENTRKILKESESTLEQYKSENQIDPSLNSKDTFEKLSQIDLELSEITLKEKLLKNVTLFIKRNRDLGSIAPTILEFNDQNTLQLLNSLQTLQQEEEKLKIEFTDKYPKLITLRRQMRSIRKSIILNVKNLRSTLLTKKISLEKQKKKYEKTLKALPKQEEKLVSFQRDYQVNAKMYTYLLEKKSENELIKVASVSDYETIDPAYTPPNPIKPKKMVFLIIATIVGFIIAIVISLLRALLVDKISNTKEVELLTHLPIFGVIPLFKNPVLNSDQLKIAYQKLATNIQFSKKGHEGNIVLISSSKEGEGKTTTIANLAGVFHQSQYKSVLVDFNMNNPKLHGYFGLEHQYAGVSTYLSGRDNIGNVIFSTNYPNLDVVTAGPTPPNSLELILSPRLDELLQTLKEKYDYIFIDTADYNSSIEALYLMQYADNNLIVLKEGSSKKSTLNQLEKMIQEKNIKNVGLVIQSKVKKSKKDLNALGANTKAIPNIKQRPVNKPIQLSL